MTTARFNVRITDERGAFLRVIALVERRQFVIRTARVAPHSAGDGALVEFEVARGPLSFESLACQLERLHDVRAVAIESHGTALTPASSRRTT